MLEILVSIVVIVFIIEALLDFLNQRSAVLPPDPLVAGLYDAKERNRSIEYGAAKYRVGLVSGTVSTSILILALTQGWLAELDRYIGDFVSVSMIQSLLFIGALSMISW